MIKPPKFSKSFDSFVKKVAKFKPTTLLKAPPHKPKKAELEKLFRYNRKTGEIDVIEHK